MTNGYSQIPSQAHSMLCEKKAGKLKRRSRGKSLFAILSSFLDKLLAKPGLLSSIYCTMHSLQNNNSVSISSVALGA